MPTAARLVAALSLAALAWMVSGRLMAILPEHTAFGAFVYVNIIVGLLAGWFVVGKRVGSGWADAVGAGLTGVGAMVFWALFLQAANEMLRLALLRRFDGPVEALVAVFQKGLEFGEFLLDPQVLGLLVIGGVVTGLLAEKAERAWG